MKQFFIILIFSSLFLTENLFTQQLNIIPKPVSVISADEKFILDSGSKIFYTDKRLKRIAGILKNTLHKRTGINTFIQRGKSDKGILLEIGINKNLKAEGYELSIDNESVRIKGNDAAGVFYGIQTLDLLLKKENEIFFPGCKIEDYPVYSHRGFMLDASRHFQSVEFVKKILDMMAQLKMNVFHWHLIDDEGWRVESRKYPKLNEIGSYCDSLNARERNGYYTADEIKDVLRYAKNLFIQILPEIEMPGHSRSVMASYPELLCPTDSGGKTYCAGNSKSYEFIKNCIDEIITIFHPEIIHVGGDERPKGIWEKCPVCQQMILNKGLADENMLQNYFMKDICNFVSQKGIKTIAWAENIKDGIPENQIVEGWHPGESWDAARHGYYTINADNIYTYFDYPSYPRLDKPEWMPVLNLEKVYSFNPTPDSLNENEKKYVLGSECALWTELILENDVQYQIFPRILAFSEVVWSPISNKNYNDFLNRVNGVRSFINSKGFEYEKGSW